MIANDLVEVEQLQAEKAARDAAREEAKAERRRRTKANRR